MCAKIPSLLLSIWFVCGGNAPIAGVPEMGAKQSAVGSHSLSQSPTLKNIQEAYTDGEDQRARELIRLSCENNSGEGPDGVSLIIFSLCAFMFY